MARVETSVHHYVDIEGAKQELRLAFDVNKQGVFSVNVPEWLIDNLRALHRKDGWRDLSLEQLPKNFRVSGDRLASVQGLINEALREYSAPDIQSELVIVYCVNTQATAWELPDGQLVPNGVVAEALWNEQRGDHESVASAEFGGWPHEFNGKVSGSRPGPGYMVQVNAYVAEKTTTVRGASVKLDYQRISAGWRGDVDDAIWRLNSFTGLSTLTSSNFSEGVQEIPYTPEGADFFYSMLIGLASLSLRMERFFSDKAVLLDHISKNHKLLASSLLGSEK